MTVELQNSYKNAVFNPSRMFLTDDISNSRLSAYILVLNHYWKKNSIIRLLVLLFIIKYILS